MDPTESKFQRLRLQRFYLAQISYFITYVVIALAWAADQYVAGPYMAASHIALGIFCQLVIFLMFRTNINLRFKDPSLTHIQLVIAMLLSTYLLMFVGDIRGSLIMLYPFSLLFGVFLLSMRAFIIHAVLALMCFTALLLFDISIDYSQKKLSVHLLEWFVLASFLFWLCFFGNYIRQLKERLQQRHTTLQAHQETLKGMMGQLQNLAATDSLTGLANRRYFLDEAARRIHLIGPGKTLGLALIDLDHFKRINDLYGHAAGDEVLQKFAQLAKEKLRGDDLIARFGGEEFILLLGNSDLATLHHCLERIRIAFAELSFPSLPDDVTCTLSAGLSLIHGGDDLEHRINEADQALYQAKDDGRNRCQAHRAAYA